jgi:hypothetical protein
MKKISTVLIAGLAAAMLAGCANGFVHGRATYVIGYYDGYYGPYPGGYWRDGYFYYLGPDRQYHRDLGSHFRHDSFTGAKKFRAEDRRQDANRRDRGRDHRDNR